MNLRILSTALLAVLALGSGLFFSSHRTAPKRHHTRAVYKMPARPADKDIRLPKEQPGETK